MRKLVIDRAKWQCKGHENGDTYLLNRAGKLCCLGFHARELGCGESRILGVPSPEQLEYKRIPEGLPVEIYHGAMIDLPWANKAIEVNDNISDDAEREAEIASIFKEQGWEVEFVGEYSKWNAFTEEA